MNSRNQIPWIKNQFLPNVVDRRAVEHPEAVFGEYPLSPQTYGHGFRSVTYKDLANVINGLAHWLKKTLGVAGSSEHLPYLGPNDVRYPALILAAVKVGHTIFLTSPRNSRVAQKVLLDRLKCRYLLCSTPSSPQVVSIMEVKVMKLLEVPSLDELLGQDFVPCPMVENVKMSDLFVIIHTSGSTGIPKPLFWTHATAAAMIEMASLSPPAGYDSLDAFHRGKRLFISFPPFHGAYLVIYLFNAIPFGSTVIAPLSEAIMTAESLVEVLESNQIDVAWLVPSVVQGLSQNVELLRRCSQRLEAILYCGGDLPIDIGDTVVKHILLFNQHGASEIGLIPQIMSKSNHARQDWKYSQFHPNLGLELRKVTDDMHELYVIRSAENSRYQPTFTIFPDLDEYASRDLFKPHPSRKNDMWSWQARADDILVFLNGEKTNPIAMEQYVVSQGTDIVAALVVGAQRVQAALLLECAETRKHIDPSERAIFIESIWPVIEEANKQAPSHARISKSHVLLTEGSKPMLRAGKGTVQRAGTLQLYQREIDALYRDADMIKPDFKSSESWARWPIDHVALTQQLRDLIYSITNWSTLDEGTNLFTLGMDSLQVLMLVRALRGNLKTMMISPSMIYGNPTLSELAAAIECANNEEQENLASQRTMALREKGLILQEYIHRLDGIRLSNGMPHKISEGEVVLLTGSTGSLGSYILDSLTRHSKIRHIYCLNRGENTANRQQARNKSNQLYTSTDPERVTFLSGDLSQRTFGLEMAVFQKLTSEITSIIHNAWPVNFNVALATFRPNLDGLINLISFAASAPSQPHLVFVSSISSTIRSQTPSGFIPEAILDDDAASALNGYGESKYISELLVEHAANLCKTRMSIVRIGQITGVSDTRKGSWNRSEWFPRMVISAAHLHALPDSLGPVFDNVDWIPVDQVAAVLVEITLDVAITPDKPDREEQANVTSHSGKRMATSVFHVRNPDTRRWQNLLPGIKKTLESISTAQIETVEMAQWLTLVRLDFEKASCDDGSWKSNLERNLEANPAAALLDFYEEMLVKSEGVARLEVEETMQRSRQMQKVQAIEATWLGKWLEVWLKGH